MNNKKAIFLDIDGVLNIRSPTYTSTWVNDVGRSIEPILMKRLEYLVSQTNGILVIRGWKFDKLIDELKKQRFYYTSKLKNGLPGRKRWRGDQIQEYIECNGVTRYVVLKSNTDDVCGEHCYIIPKENVIHVDMNEGLSNNDCLTAINKLNAKFLKKDTDE